MTEQFDIRNSAFGLRMAHHFDIRNSTFGLRPVPPRGNANFAWVQHFIHHLAPHGMAGFVLVRFWLWVKKGCHRTRSREETGNGYLVCNEAYGCVQ